MNLQDQFPDGRYGIDSLEKGVEAANNIYDLVDVTYGDDKKWGPDDWVDVIGKGPTAIQSVIRAANVRGSMDEELFDLSENEKDQLVALAGSRIQKPGYAKILRGCLELVDGVAEMKNPDNPTT